MLPEWLSEVFVLFPAYRYAFNKYNEHRIDSRNVTYDFKSIMHYGYNAFSSNRKATIVAKNSNVTEFGNIHLSPLDIQQANLMYNCPGWIKCVDYLDQLTRLF